jgi:hypothetical protein
MGTKKIETGNKYVARKSAHPVIPAVDFVSPKQRSRSKRSAIPGAAPSRHLRRHLTLCRICTHARRQEIEDDFVAWVSPAKIAVDYKLTDRSTMYRHAHALNLFPRRRRNVRAALERIIEHASDIKVNASAVVAAVQALAKINARGELIERDENLTVQNLIDRMTAEELSAYSKRNSLPTWFQDEITAAGGQVPKEDIDA